MGKLQRKVNLQFEKIYNAKIRAPIGKKWNPETHDRNIQVDALKTLKFPDCPEHLGLKPVLLFKIYSIFLLA